MQAIDRRPFHLTALTLLASGMICILAACGPAISPLRQSENGAIPTSQAKRNPPLGLSARLVERLANPAMAINGPLHFGDAIDLDGDTLAVGAPERSGLIGLQRGSVFVFQRGWDGLAKPLRLTASDQEDGFQTDLHFGSALALDGNTLMVGAPGANDRRAGVGAGAVYVFERQGETWKETAILRAADPRSKAGFGSLVRLREDVLLVSGGYGGTGVYVFERQPQGWIEKALLTGDQMGEKESFGYSLAAGEDCLAVGAVQTDSQTGRFTGEVYIFRRRADGWAKETVLSTGPAYYTLIPNALDIDGQTLAVGGGDDSGGVMSGAVYLFQSGPDGWKLQERLTPGDALAASMFGYSLGLEGDLLAVGAGFESGEGLSSGSAYLFRRYAGTWHEQLKLWPADEDFEGSYYGSHLALGGNTLLVAAPGEFGNAVYVYEISGH